MPIELNRLLTQAQVAAKLGRPVTWFIRNRVMLEANGFPIPRVKAPEKKKHSELWAERAVDAWVTMSDEGLQTTNGHDSEQQFWANTLSKRLDDAPIGGVA